MIAGMYDQASRLLKTIPPYSEQRHKHSNESYLDVYWQLRTADVVVELPYNAILVLRSAINSHSKF